MLESSGSILQLPSRVKTLNQVNLLIVTSKSENLPVISNSLLAAEMKFTFDVISNEVSPQGNLNPDYGAILYDYEPIEEHLDSLKEKLQWWLHIYPDSPLVLLTDTLGDETAVELVQLGVSGYLLRTNIYQLPRILEKTLFDFLSQKTIIEQQQNLIEQQKQEIAHFEAQIAAHKKVGEQQQVARQNHISHLVHELRSPIAAIIGFARALKEQYYGQLNDKQHEYARLLVSSGEHLLALVKNYLEITKIDADKQTLELEKIVVWEICQASVLMLQDKADAKDLVLDYTLEEGIDFCQADSMRLKQILINLLSNAIKFTNEGSVSLKVSCHQGYLHFAVSDTGTGIAESNLGKLFQPFPQISNHHENTGLGLTLSKKLAQLHGGDITVQSQVGQGSCFTLMIPNPN